MHQRQSESEPQRCAARLNVSLLQSRGSQDGLSMKRGSFLGGTDSLQMTSSCVFPYFKYRNILFALMVDSKMYFQNNDKSQKSSMNKPDDGNLFLFSLFFLLFEKSFTFSREISAKNPLRAMSLPL